MKLDHPRPVCVTCGKLYFRSRKQSLTALNRLRGKIDHSRRTAPIATYKCRHCGGWHLTSRGPGS